MAAEPLDSSFWTVVAAIGAAAITWGATTIGHLFQSRASMAALVDARIRTLIDGYERRIADLQGEIRILEGKVDALGSQLEKTELSIERCDSCGKWVRALKATIKSEHQTEEG